MTVGSPFTVGVTDEERDIASMTELVAAPERTHKMAATTTGHVITAIHESSQVTADLRESCQVTPGFRKPSQVTVDLCESSQVTAAISESSHR